MDRFAVDGHKIEALGNAPYCAGKGFHAGDASMRHRNAAADARTLRHLTSDNLLDSGGYVRELFFREK